MLIKSSYLFLIAPLFLFSQYALADNKPNSYAKKLLNQQFGFTENIGQIKTLDGNNAEEVNFILNQGSSKVILTKKGISYQFENYHYSKNNQNELNQPNHSFNRHAQTEKMTLETHRMDIELIGMADNIEVTKNNKLSNYINDYRTGHLKINAYGEIIYHNVYPGIDWIVYTNDGSIKYDFLLHPGADPSLIRLKINDHDGLKINYDGSLTMSNSLGNITEKAPVSFQEGKLIGTKFRLIDENTFGFDVDDFNAENNLTIDPSIMWSTYYGGSIFDGVTCVRADLIGNVIISGYTTSTNAIAYSGHQNSLDPGTDAFVAKFDGNGILQWASYYGGTGTDQGRSCVADNFGNVYLAGYTAASNAIASNGHQNNLGGGTDAFLVKFNPAGTRLWATYYGGSGSDDGFSTTIDWFGNVFLAGSTTSASSISSGGHQNSIGGSTDGFLVKFNSTGVRQWATYYGGSGLDYGQGLAADTLNNIYFCGYTSSSSGIASGGHQNSLGGSNDAFIAKFNSSGIRQWASYYGDIGYDDASDCNIDGQGNILIAGVTNSNSNIANSAHQTTYGGGNFDAYVAKFRPNGTRHWASYYGGSGSDHGIATVGDLYGNVYLVGQTNSSSAINSGGFQPNYGGGSADAYIVKFDSLGSRLWGSYFGGDNYDWSTSVFLAKNNGIYFAGETVSASGIVNLGHQNIYGGGDLDGFLVRLDSTGAIPQTPTITVRSLDCGMMATSFSDLVRAIPVNGATSYQWEFKNVDDAFLETINTPYNFIELSWVNAIQPSKTYEVKVRAKASGLWGEFGSACDVTTPAIPTTTLATIDCNTSVSSMGEEIRIAKVIGATNYEVLVENAGDVYSETYQTGSSYNLFKMSDLPLPQFNTIYNVKVKVYINGSWGAYGGVCTITTPGSAPTVQVRATQCNNPIASLSTPIGCTKALGAQDYQWNVVHVGDGVDETFVKGYNNNYFKLNQVPGTMLNRTYDVKVKVKVSGTWGAYGPICTITTPAGKTDGLVWEDDEELLDMFAAYPNPSTGQTIYMNIPYNEDVTVSELFLTDLAGNIIYAEKMTEISGKTELNPAVTSKLSAGIYLLKLNQGKGNTQVIKLAITQ